nr:small nuclear ribonucleoprotein-associated protein N-like [Microcebus murinus]
MVRAFQSAAGRSREPGPRRAGGGGEGRGLSCPPGSWWTDVPQKSEVTVCVHQVTQAYQSLTWAHLRAEGRGRGPLREIASECRRWGVTPRLLAGDASARAPVVGAGLPPRATPGPACSARGDAGPGQRPGGPDLRPRGDRDLRPTRGTPDGPPSGDAPPAVPGLGSPQTPSPVELAGAAPPARLLIQVDKRYHLLIKVPSLISLQRRPVKRTLFIEKMNQMCKNFL